MTCVICARDVDAGHARDPCRLRLDRTLSDIADLHAQLPDALERGSGGGQKVSGSREAPLPLHVDALDLSLPYRTHRAVSDPDHARRRGVRTGALSRLPLALSADRIR